MTTALQRKGRPTAQDARQKLADILKVARDQFAELGYRAVTMRGVADKAQVSTRTLYNRYADKLSLFGACLDFGAAAFPHIGAAGEAELESVLRGHAAAIVRVLSIDISVRLGMLVYREGGEFPELLRAAEENQDRYLVQPLAAFFRAHGLGGDSAEATAKVFIAMALSEWNRRVTFRHPVPTEAEIESHARFAVALFLGGLNAAASRRT